MRRQLIGLKAVVQSPNELAELLRAHGMQHYVYILRKPDGVESFGGTGTPIYVGEGNGARAFAHVREARVASSGRSLKLDSIREVEDAGTEVIHEIDSIGEGPLLQREADLILQIGTIRNGTGPLTNEQSYAPANAVDGRVMRKYANDGRSDPLSIPSKFRVRHLRLMHGPNTPASATSVHGRLHALLVSNPGLTGEELLMLAAELDWSAHKSAYTQSGKVDLAWLIGYIDSAVFKANRGFMHTI
jgi:hypothetical protein